MSDSSSEVFEFENVDHQTYYQNQEIALDILNKVSNYYSIPISEVRYKHVINFFFNCYDIRFSIFENKTADPFNRYANSAPSTDLVSFNALMALKKMHIKASQLNFVNPQFSDNVDGLTVNQEQKHAMLINYSINYFPRLIFTILHELSHIYLAESNNKYLGLVAKINKCKTYGDPYPRELRPIETGANIIASELFANKLALEDAIKSNYTFDEMRSMFGMSKGALHNRLLNYLEHSQLFAYSFAKDCTFKIRNQGQDGIREIKGLILLSNGGNIHNPHTRIDAFDNTIFL
ncbi:ImmA/IrrE family metallo-endopeptidase [Limosilactobacillus sp. WF-MT5-A]|uniref:ImmA/IrrE family metallo-endopeptidase n=1 Tax=Limosilactobacillus agrestis TaxID=2759748 RepID=UPI0015F8EF3F|nr:ImmA/IrrE family metallo-endopeptidase [Limosilactobacillus agrestis]MBB1099916.1 ImmA/IrrE family metallo-endopeptidase [Limosilactobacillus agrestis]MCD7120832.1 ImmA/IrrE family metallo-endopeptidase [Limosilactobacillus agrestis]MCD7126110.1 ImmA/IrrE family metallo-endopeptidase [Limosilactobacillus agrestis]